MSAERLRIVLDIDPEAEPIGGLLSGDHDPPSPFSGWLALGRALEQELAFARGASPGPTPPSSFQDNVRRLP